MLGLPLVANLGHVAGVAVDRVLDLLQATVGELHVVVAFGFVAVASFLVAEVVSRVVVLYPVGEVVLSRALFMKLRLVVVIDSNFKMTDMTWIISFRCKLRSKSQFSQR